MNTTCNHWAPYTCTVTGHRSDAAAFAPSWRGGVAYVMPARFTLADAARLLRAYESTRSKAAEELRSEAPKAARAALASAMASGKPGDIESALRSAKLALELGTQPEAAVGARGVTVVEAHVVEDPDADRAEEDDASAVH